MYLRAIVVLAVTALLAGCIVSITDHQTPRVGTIVGETHGTLELTSNVEGAEVYIDGDLCGLTDRAFHTRRFILDAGSHDLVVQKPQFENYHTTVNVPANGSTRVTATLKPLAPSA